MAWFQEVVQKARATGDALKDQVQQGAAVVRARAQQFEEVIASNLQTTQFGSIAAEEVENQLEADAQGLSRTAPAIEIVQRWVMLLRTLPQPRYMQTAAGTTNSPDAPPEELTFQQLFLRCNALELALDAVTRSPELRGHLRSHALPLPEVWPEEKTQPIAFAHAFTQLLRATIGPSEIWIDFFVVLLSSDKGPSDEPCHAWLLQLIAGLRTSWEDASMTDREREVEALEAAARHGLEVANQSDVDATRANMKACLSSLAQRGAAVGTAYRAWTLRQSLAEDMAKAVARSEDLVVARRASASSVAMVAAERIVVLDAEAARLHANTEELKKNLSVQVETVKEELRPYETSRQKLERELEEVELTQAELMRQIGELSERRNSLKKKLGEGAKKTEGLRMELQHAEQDVQDRLAGEELAHCRIQNARALADAVANLATGLAAPGKQDSHSKAMFASTLGDEAFRCRERAALSALDLGERECARLSSLSQVIDVCCGVAEDRETSREAMTKLGVSAATLEADIVGEAEIERSLQDAITEVDRCKPEAETLVGTLAELAKEDNASQGIDTQRAAANAEMLLDCLSQLRTGRERLVALLPQEIVILEEGSADATAKTDGTVDSFLGDASTKGTAAAPASNPIADASASAMGLLSRFGAGWARGEGAATSGDLRGSAEAALTTREIQTAAPVESCAVPQTQEDWYEQESAQPETLAPAKAASDDEARAATTIVVQATAASPTATSATASLPSIPSAVAQATAVTADASAPRAAVLFRMDADEDEEAEEFQRKSASPSLDPFHPPPRVTDDPADEPPSLPAAAAPMPPAERW